MPMIPSPSPSSFTTLESRTAMSLKNLLQRSARTLSIPANNISTSFRFNSSTSSSSSTSTSLPPGLSPSLPVSSLCIPLSPPYSIKALLQPVNTPPPPLLSSETLKQLHRLSALPYPSCSAEEMAGLIGVIEGIRGEEVTRLLQEGGQEEMGWGRKEIVFDGREEQEERVEWEETGGRKLLENATRKSGVYYVVDKKTV
ncbi:hypothetical protein BDY24DRAFT_419076 [Mrakia frigida]|uniref:uncharacterized protein n=1 Tax=Mrakia frigida TaxID=29902 RepID=UPI003FCC12D7